ncbi:MAG: Gfo/Idh/MocA family oxidoreductase [Truepera sp.]|nr:Gfo/Idh/MocA family oxidoreductase [Truepera sp.]
MAAPVKVALVGCGTVALHNHLPGLALAGARLTALCDSDPAVLERARQQTGVRATYSDYHALLDADCDAVIIATPNHTHAPITLAAIAAGKHVFCEKPLAMNRDEAAHLLQAAEQAGVRHMTAFTYRFVPAMRYAAQLVAEGALGQPYHFRSCRLQDWGSRAVGWRQVAALAGTGELGDMLSHRIDYAHLLVGPIASLAAQLRRYLDRRDGQPADVEDWVALLADFESGASGVLESSKLATGHGEGLRSQDYVEVNGSEGSIIYQLTQPLELLLATREHGLRTLPVPEALRVWPGSPRDPDGDPRSFRYDQLVEFVQAIVEERPCRPSFADGLKVQIVMDTALQATRERRWLEVSYG